MPIVQYKGMFLLDDVSCDVSFILKKHKHAEIQNIL